MKKIIYSLIAFFVIIFIACEEDAKTGPLDPSGPWNAGPLIGIKATPINGGAEITYDIPNDPGIMYVMAEYERNGKMFTEKSSVHSNKIKIEGFHQVNHVKATLYAVNRFEQRSEPTTVEFEPLASLIDIATNSLELLPSFGGIQASWDNPQATELGIRLLIYDDSIYHQFSTYEVYYSQILKENHNFRGHDAIKTIFGISFEDKWGNVSDTIQYTTTPLFETLIPKPYVDFRGSIPYDNISNNGNKTLAMTWDNIVNTSYNGWRALAGNDGLSFTIDMKQVVKLSRILHHAYHVNAPFGNSNATAVEIWGTDKIDFASISNKDYWLDSLSVVESRFKNISPLYQLPERTFKDDWQYLGYYELDLNMSAEEQRQLSADGAEYLMPIDARPVRYIRIFARRIAKTMPPPIANNFTWGEITFFGDNTITVN